MQTSTETHDESDARSETHEQGTLGSVIGSLGGPIVIGLIAFWAFLFAMQQEWIQSELLARYLSAHPVSYIATAMFFVGMAGLGIKLCNVIAQIVDHKNIKLSPPPALPQRAETSRLLLAEFDDMTPARQNSYMGIRLRSALDHVDKTESANHLDDELKYLADLDASKQQESFSLTRILIWAIPMLGFLGTVIGISGALGGLSVASEFETMLSALRDKLYVAFDTTALALSLSIILMFAQFVVNRLETQYLLTVDDAVSDELAGRFITFGGSRDPYLSSVENMSRSVLESVRDIGKEQSEAWQNGLLKISDTTEQVLGNFAQVLSTRLGAQLDSMLNDFGVTLRGSIKESGNILEKHVEQLTRVVEGSDQAMESHRKQFGEMMAHSNNHLRETFEQVTQSVDEKADDMKRHMAYTTESLKDYNRNIISEFSDLVSNRDYQTTIVESISQNLSGTLGKVVGALGESLNNNQNSIDSITRNLEEISGKIGDSVASQKDVIQTHSQQALAITQLSERIEATRECLEASSKSLLRLEDMTRKLKEQGSPEHLQLQTDRLVAEFQLMRDSMDSQQNEKASGERETLQEILQAQTENVAEQIKVLQSAVISLEQSQMNIDDAGIRTSIQEGLERVAKVVADQGIDTLVERIEALQDAYQKPTEHQVLFLEQQKQTIANQNQLLAFCHDMESTNKSTFLDTSKKILTQHAEAATKSIQLEETVRELSFSIHLLNQSLAAHSNEEASGTMRFTKPEVPKRVA